VFVLPWAFGLERFLALRLSGCRSKRKEHFPKKGNALFCLEKGDNRKRMLS
jgi:hypothetical protein